MARTIRRDQEIEEFNDDTLRMEDREPSEPMTFSLEDDDVESLELGDRGRKGFSRLNDRDMFGYRD